MFRTLLLWSLVTLLWGAINPFVLFNQEKITQHQVLIPLPSEQMIDLPSKRGGYYPTQPDTPLWLTIAPLQDLYILLKEPTPLTLKCATTEDGRLLEPTELTRHISPTTQQVYYHLTNPTTQMLGVRLSLSQRVELKLLTTYDTNLLQHRPRPLSLTQGEPQRIYSPTSRRSSLYYHFTEPTPLSLTLQGGGLLAVEMTTPLPSDQAGRSYRQRITLTHNHHTTDLEARTTPSLLHLPDTNQTLLSRPTTHFIPLHEGSNHLTLQTHGETLLRLTRYQKRLRHDTNTLPLRWQFDSDLRQLNQPIWRNSRRGDGLIRRESLLAQRHTLADTSQRLALTHRANQSSFLAPLYPSQTPLGSQITHANYPTYHLYTPQALEILHALPPSDAPHLLSGAKAGFFLPIPAPHAPQPLTYSLVAETSSPIEIEMTLDYRGTHPTSFELIDDQGRQRTFEIDPHTPLLPYRFAKSIAGVKYLTAQGKDPQQLLAQRNQTRPLPLLRTTATYTLTLPKGTQQLSFRTRSPDPLRLSLRIRQSSTYRDTPYALRHTYGGSYQRFLRSLTAPLPQAFSAWYEQTHPLRLWCLARIARVQQQIHSTQRPQTLHYATTLAQRGDRSLARAIAKHTLLLSPTPTEQLHAYQLLLSLAQDSHEQSLYHLLYAWRTHSLEALQALALYLEEEGQESLALTLRLLLPATAQNIRSAHHLAQHQQHQRLADLLLPHSPATPPTQNLTHTLKVTHTAGVATLYSPAQHRYLHSYHATASQPLTLSVEGPVRLTLRVRLTDTTPPYEWMRIDHNGATYHYPLTQTQRSSTLTLLPTHTPIGDANTLTLDLGKGQHHLRIQGDTQPLLLSLKAHRLQRAAPPLPEQLLATPHNGALALGSPEQTPPIPYLASLLWNQTHGSHHAYEEAQARAWLYKGDRLYQGVEATLLRLLTRFSRFRPLQTLQTPLGFYDMPLPAWSPRSTLQRNRTPLIAGINSYDAIITGERPYRLHMQGEKQTTLHFAYLTPRYLPTEPLCFALYYDGVLEKMIQLDSNHTTHEESLKLSRGDHTLTLRLSHPLSTHYLGLRLYEEGKRVTLPRYRRYYYTTPQTPLRIQIQGPRLLRIEERTSEYASQVRYRYLPLPKRYTVTLPPTHFNQESLIALATLSFDPMIRPLRIFERTYHLPWLLGESQWFQEAIAPPHAPHTTPTRQSFIPTGSLGIAWQGQRDSEEGESATLPSHTTTSLSLHSRLSPMSYFTQHYFIEHYANPLYGLFDHTLSTRLPLADTQGSLRLSGYFQKNNGYLFKRILLKGKLTHTTQPTESLQMHYTLGGAFAWLDFDNPNATPLSPLVYSRYQRDHRYGLSFNYRLDYLPYDDVTYSIAVEANSNEQVNIIDNLHLKLTSQELYYPLDLTLFYDLRYYFEDRDRPHSYSRSRVGARVRFNRFFGEDRLELTTGLYYTLQEKQTALSFGVKWHLGENHLLENFAPNQTTFKALRLRLNDKEAYADR